MAIYKNSVPFGNIVKDGLVLNLDATNINSYPGSGTTWTDTSGNNNNGTLTNGPTFLSERGRGSIVFDGVDDYALAAPINGAQTCTYNLWLKWGASGVNKTIFGNENGLYFTTSAGIRQRSSNIYAASNGIGSALIVQTTTLSAGIRSSWHMVTFTMSGTSASLYLNGTIAAQSFYTGSNTNTGSYYIGAANYANPEAFSGSISSIQVYNRALSAQEVQQNYNALKSRFGL